MTSISRTDRALLLLLRRSLFQSDEKMVLSVNEWKDVVCASYEQAVVLLALDGTDGLPSVPQSVLMPWQKLAFRLQWQNEQLYAVQDKVVSLFREAGIPTVILKGSACAANYPNPTLRTMGDIDLLVDPCRLKESKALLKKNGYKADVPSGLSEHHVSFSDGACHIELHHSVNGIPKDGDAARMLRSLFSHAVDCTEECHVGEHTFCAPKPLLQSLVLLLHTASHISQSGIGLRHLVDWALFMQRALAPEKISARSMKTMLLTWEQCGLLHFARLLSMATTRAFGTPIMPWFANVDVKKADLLLTDFLASGNLGKRRFRDEYGTTLITNKATVASAQVPLAVRVWKNVVSSTDAHFPAVRRYPVLYIGALPFNLLIKGCELCRRKQLFRFGKTLQISHRRLQFIDSLSLFEAPKRKQPTRSIRKKSEAPKQQGARKKAVALDK